MYAPQWGSLGGGYSPSTTGYGGYGGYPSYPPLYQQQAIQNVYASQLNALGYPAPVAVQTEESVATPKVCSEFAWLRNRVNEVLWK